MNLSAYSSLLRAIELAVDPWLCSCQRVHDLSRAPVTGGAVRVRCDCGQVSDVNVLPWPPAGGRPAVR